MMNIEAVKLKIISFWCCLWKLYQDFFNISYRVCEWTLSI